MAWQDLERYFAVQLRVMGQIHCTHSALADLRADFVATEFCPGRDAQRVTASLIRTFKKSNCTVPIAASSLP